MPLIVHTRVLLIWFTVVVWITCLIVTPGVGDLCSVLAMSSGYTFIVLCVPPPTAQVEWLPGAYSREDNVKISQIK